MTTRHLSQCRAAHAFTHYFVHYFGGLHRFECTLLALRAKFANSLQAAPLLPRWGSGDARLGSGPLCSVSYLGRGLPDGRAYELAPLRFVLQRGLERQA